MKMYRLEDKKLIVVDDHEKYIAVCSMIGDRSVQKSEFDEALEFIHFIYMKWEELPEDINIKDASLVVDGINLDDIIHKIKGINLDGIFMDRENLNE